MSDTPHPEYLRGLREAAEIARTLPVMATSERLVHAKCDGANEVAEAIESRIQEAEGKPLPPPPAKEKL